MLSRLVVTFYPNVVQQMTLRYATQFHVVALAMALTARTGIDAQGLSKQADG